MPRPSMVEINCKRDENIRALVKRLKKDRMKKLVNGGSYDDVMEAIYVEVGAQFNKEPGTIKQICSDKFYSLRYLKRQGNGQRGG